MNNPELFAPIEFSILCGRPRYKPSLNCLTPKVNSSNANANCIVLPPTQSLHFVAMYVTKDIHSAKAIGLKMNLVADV